MILTPISEAWDMFSDVNMRFIVDKLVIGSIVISPNALIAIKIIKISQIYIFTIILTNYPTRDAPIKRFIVIKSKIII